MKRINITLIILLLFVCNACDMDKLPHGQLEADKPITLEDCRSLHAGLYSSFRSLTTGSFVTYGELQTDGFHTISGFSGSLNAFYNGSITPGLELIEDIWAGNYVGIGQANYFLFKTEELLSTNRFTEKENIEVGRYIGGALFMRAYCYFDLVQKFCPVYTVENAGKAHAGLPLTTKYNPTDDNTQYPGRSTLEATYDLILGDLEQALDNLLEFESKYADELPLQAMSAWINSDVVKSLQARIALVMGNYERALKLSEELINTRRYALINNEEYLSYLWEWDLGTEAIWMVSMTVDYLGSATGSTYLANTGTNMAFIPTAAIVNLYGKNDIRTNVYLGDRAVRVTGGNATIKAFTKYPGNPDLYSNTGINNFTNMSKPFRIAEQYLIAAEAAAMTGVNSKANQYLNTLKRSRITGYTSLQLIGDNLIKAIREERQRELIGEGFRLSDLKRWREGFRRSAAQNSSVINQLGNVHLLSYEADDYRFIWPIPQGEIDVNPQIKNQQNPGY